ncbi:hypothetical protein SAMN04515674_12021 [Pseudarcicella hirudinis]|uniref:Uncharacterized protein n=1 Tax=Pseudarcicella hirudinis TaxID=1079859 RepID=A0A1I5YMX0_9BACT|nr:DUF6326 family protein [Pseudarcicella hirudinis]SFQ45566.1 hypothetical protein SAMN04515674_12021 [Pseudarcicella hirudinis]
MISNKNKLEDFGINIKIKLSALWIAVMFCYVYGDYFILFVPGHIKDMMDGNSGVGNTSPVSILSFALMMTFPILMIVLSLVLTPQINRWANISVGIIFTLIMALIVFTSKGKWMLFYIYLGCVEIILTSLIVWLAWKWPGQAD